MAREVRVAIIGDPSSLQRALRTADGGVTQFGRRMQSFGSRMSAVGSSLSRNLTLPLVGFGVLAWRELSSGERALAQTQAVIESTGGAARRSVDDILELSASLSELTSLDDEPIQEAANTLLTFQQIAGETFDDATRATLDLSVAMDRDLRSSAVMVGRALNDPVRGMQALTRVGVQFSDRQREWIEHLVETGDVMGAQRVILAELTAEFGGSAEALGGTVAGRFNRLKNNMEELGASILEDLLPVLEDLADILGTVADAYSELTPAQQKFAAGAVALAAVAGPLSSVIGVLSSALGALAAVLGVSAGLVGAVIAAVAALGVALYVLHRNWSTATSMMQSFLTLARGIPGVGATLQVLGGAVRLVQSALRTVVTTAAAALRGFVALGSASLSGLLGAINALLGPLARAVDLAFQLKNALTGSSAIQNYINENRPPVGEGFIPSRSPATASAPGLTALSPDEIGRAVARHLRGQPLMTVGVG